MVGTEGTRDEPSMVDRLLLFIVDPEAEYGDGRDRIRRVGRLPDGVELSSPALKRCAPTELEVFVSLR